MHRPVLLGGETRGRWYMQSGQREKSGSTEFQGQAHSRKQACGGSGLMQRYGETGDNGSGPTPDVVRRCDG